MAIPNTFSEHSKRSCKKRIQMYKTGLLIINNNNIPLSIYYYKYKKSLFKWNHVYVFSGLIQREYVSSIKYLPIQYVLNRVPIKYREEFKKELFSILKMHKLFNKRWTYEK